MAYTETQINNDWTKLSTVLSTLVTNGIVGAVDVDTSGSQPVITIYKEAEKTTELFKITMTVKYDKVFTFKATASDGNYLNCTNAVWGTIDAGHIIGYRFSYGYASESGVFFTIEATVGNDQWAVAYTLIITKNQEGAPVFVFTNNTKNDCATTAAVEAQLLLNLNTEYIVCSTDKAPLATLSRSAPAARSQTVLSPFFSCSETGHASYTPFAGRVLAGGISNLVTNARLSEILFDSAIWITNGYWALKVGDTV